MPTEHPVRRKLRQDILPYVVSARRLHKQWFYRLHVVFGYATDLVVALAAIGVSTPLLGLVTVPGTSAAAGQKSVNFADILAAAPSWLSYPIGALVIFWIVLRVAFVKEDGEKRAVLAKSCSQVFREVEAKLPQFLGNSNPMPELNELLKKQIFSTVDRHIQERSWPWTPFAPGIDDEVDQELAKISKQFEANWAPVNTADAVDLGAVPAEGN